MATPSSADLMKIGAEGFALIDKFYGTPHRRSADAFPGGQRERSTWVVQQLPNDAMEHPAAMNCRDAAIHFGGVAVVNFPKGKPQNRWGRSTH